MAQETVEIPHICMTDVETKIVVMTGGYKITVSPTPPSNPNVGDIWIETSV